MKRILSLVVLALVTVGAIVLTGLRNGWFDSKVYHGAIQYWFRDGGMVYDFLRPGTPYGFTYPPFAGLVMSPMAYLPILAVAIIATLATIAATAAVVRWLAPSLVQRWGFLAVLLLALLFEPVRETITFGQVNMLLLALVTADMVFGVARGRKWAGVGIGLAVAIKLTPGVFILYLLATRRWRALAVSIGSAAGATLLAGALFPDESREFWTSALWDTNRVGLLHYLSNQSERGLLARLPLDVIESSVWLVLVLATLAVWAWRVSRSADDVLGGLALTGALGCLISPVTWIHHCVWLIPALILAFDRGRRVLAVSGYVLMTSHLAWWWEKRPRPPLELIGGNLYVWFSLALLIWTPLSTRRSPAVNEPVKIIQ
jgi:alpha-1,2-mannosyltransferase